MDNYPPGAANDPNAPYNQVYPDYVDINVCVSYSISKSTTLSVNDYSVEEWEDAERDDDGHIYRTGGINYDFSDCNLESAYNEEITLIDIIKQCYDYAKAELDTVGEKTGHGKYLKRLMSACEGWNVDELEIVEE